MSTLPVPCPGCGLFLDLPAAARGRQVRCLSCQASFRVSPPAPPPFDFDAPRRRRPRRRGTGVVWALLGVGVLLASGVAAGVVALRGVWREADLGQPTRVAALASDSRRSETRIGGERTVSERHDGPAKEDTKPRDTADSSSPTPAASPWAGTWTGELTGTQSDGEGNVTNANRRSTYYVRFTPTGKPAWLYHPNFGKDTKTAHFDQPGDRIRYVPRGAGIQSVELVSFEANGDKVTYVLKLDFSKATNGGGLSTSESITTVARFDLEKVGDEVRAKVPETSVRQYSQRTLIANLPPVSVKGATRTELCGRLKRP